MDVMDNWDDGTENTFTKFADETELVVWWTCQKGKQSEREAGGLEEWASKNFMKFNKDKCKV